jgi:hypothetical protein
LHPRFEFARIQSVVRNLQILLEQSNLWKGELASMPASTAGMKNNHSGDVRDVLPS